MRLRIWTFTLAALVGFAAATPAPAAMAVIDVAAIARLAQQIQTLQQQLATARSQLQQAQDAYRAMTGGRGMQQLLAGAPRNYLPPDWSELANVLSASSATYGALASELQRIVAQNAVLTDLELAAVPTAQRLRIEEARRQAALLQALSREALQTTSARFASLQSLIVAIGSASDQKAILDLQARIDAEQGMLQNEHTKLHLLYQVSVGERWAREQQLRERAIRDVGRLRDLPPMGL